MKSPYPQKRPPRSRGGSSTHKKWFSRFFDQKALHASIEPCLGELARNGSLRRLIGIDCEAGVPKSWNMSRFLAVLGREPHLSLLREVFDVMVGRLGEVVEGLGAECVGDASHLSARRVRDADKRA